MSVLLLSQNAGTRVVYVGMRKSGFRETSHGIDVTGESRVGFNIPLQTECMPTGIVRLARINVSW